MKTEKEIQDEIGSLNKSRGTFVTQTVEWKVFNYAIKKLEWVKEE